MFFKLVVLDQTNFSLPGRSVSTLFIELICGSIPQGFQEFGRSSAASARTKLLEFPEGIWHQYNTEYVLLDFV